ncbi:MAG TPA: cytochrome c nitrite reductase small subunit [Thermodesulfovibrionales bacterium]|nr:cytochrome c nitrite reductase small subunit [Thermodesulfovibrionales bacterium]
MGNEGLRKKALYAVVVMAIGAAALFFLLLGPPKLLAKSESPIFCSGCHVMESNYEAWIHAGAHRRKKCVDCHLPNQNTAFHYIWKSFDGLKDVAFFYSGRVPEQIKLTSHGAKVLQENCIRCHETTVEFISHERQCWECHRRISHKRSGSIETL